MAAAGFAAAFAATALLAAGFAAGAFAAVVFAAGVLVAAGLAAALPAAGVVVAGFLAAAAAGFLVVAGLAAASSAAVFVFGALDDAVLLDAEVAGLAAFAPVAGFFAWDVAGADVFVPAALDAAGLRDTGFFAGDFGAPPLVSSVIFLKLQSSLDPPSVTIITGSALWEYPLAHKRTGCAFLEGLTDFHREFKTGLSFQELRNRLGGRKAPRRLR